MDDYCKNCCKCCRLIPVIDDKKLIRDGFQQFDDEFNSLIIPISETDARNLDNDYVERVKENFPAAVFHRCSALSENNKCTADVKPSVCSEFPTSPCAFVPDECKYLGEIFLKNEELKQKIRLIKEEILDYKSRIELGDKSAKAYKKIIENLNSVINKYSDFGSDKW